MTPFHVACKRNHVKVAQLLLNYKTPVDVATTVSVALLLEQRIFIRTDIFPVQILS